MTNGTKFTVNASKTNVKSGDLYYQIADGTAKGAWVAAKDFDNAPVTVGQNQVGVKFVDADTGAQVGTTAVQTNAQYLTQAASDFINTKLAGLVPTGYVATQATQANNYTDGLTAAQVAQNTAAVKAAQYGSTVTYTVKKVAGQNLFDKTPVIDYGTGTLTNNGATSAVSFATAKTATTTEKLAALAKDANTAGVKDANIDLSKVQAAVAAQGLDTFYLVVAPNSTSYITDANELATIKANHVQSVQIQKFVFDATAFAAKANNTKNDDTAKTLTYKLTSATNVNVNTAFGSDTSFTAANVAAAFVNTGIAG